MPRRKPDKRIGGVDELDVVLCGALERVWGAGDRGGVESALETYEQLEAAGFSILAPNKYHVTRPPLVGNPKLHERQLRLIL